MEILVLWKSSKKVLQCQFISRGLSEQKNDCETQISLGTGSLDRFSQRFAEGDNFF